MTAPPFDRVVIDPEARDLPFTAGFLGRLPADLPVEVRDPQEPAPRGRRTVHVTVERGAFLRECPCSPGVVRCGYWVLSPAFQCPYACSYCFLRFYAPHEPLTLFANLAAAEAEFQAALGRWPGPVRLGTGEFSDSLALDPWTDHARWLCDLVRPHPQVLLELKTKSAAVEGLLGADAPGNVVAAWSLNPPALVGAEEVGTAPLAERLAAARRVAAAGHRVAFHFDPVVLDGAWQEAYRGVIEALFAHVEPRHVAWISLGMLRFPARFLDRWGPALRGKALFFGEQVPGEDGKLRYFWPLRRDAYRWLIATLRRVAGTDLPLYLCMEPQGMWEAATGWRPGEGQVERYLASGGPQPFPTCVAGPQEPIGLP